MEINTLSILKKAPIHSRDMKITTYACEDSNSIIVEGRLKDDRMVPYYIFEGNKKQPGTIHQMIIRMLVSGPLLTIKDIEAEMIDIPREECPNVASSVKKVKGLIIAPGLTEKVKNILGGVNGCAHLTHLLLTMASAAVQGYWTNVAQNPIPKPKPNDPIQKFILNTCHVWREDGPLVNKMKKLLEQQ